VRHWGPVWDMGHCGTAGLTPPHSCDRLSEQEHTNANTVLQTHTTRETQRPATRRAQARTHQEPKDDQLCECGNECADSEQTIGTGHGMGRHQNQSPLEKLEWPQCGVACGCGRAGGEHHTTGARAVAPKGRPCETESEASCTLWKFLTTGTPVCQESEMISEQGGRTGRRTTCIACT